MENRVIEILLEIFNKAFRNQIIHEDGKVRLELLVQKNCETEQNHQKIIAMEQY